ncbi:hypothetical protein [uncultured Zoogloea sp.]|uniref:hypothetical protein n=1 Tax=uncultured Zoogloea sp. TaxID=160237 RepID=UPI002602B80C|nr:hypothetical protein [uncultured Zoogloea sp.]
MSFWFKKPPRPRIIAASPEGASSTPTLTTYKAKDMILGIGIRSGTASAPTIPSGVGYTAINAGLGADSMGTAWAHRQCTSDGADGGLGSWTNAHGAYLVSIRNVDWKHPIGTITGPAANASNANITHGACAPANRNSAIISGAAVTSGAAPGLRADATLLKENVSATPRMRWGRSTVIPVKSWAAQVVGNDGATAAAAHHFAVEIRGRRR